MSAAQAAALGYSVIANLGDDRQLTTQCFVDSDAPLATIHAAVDKAMAVVDRQRAKYQLRDLTSERKNHAQTKERAEEDLNRLEEQYRTQVEQEKVYLGSLHAEVKQIEETAYQAGRKAPVGASKARSTAIRSTIKETNVAREKAEAERKQALINYAASIERHDAAIAEVDLKIAECNALIDGS